MSDFMIVFVHIPKTGGTTFKFILRNTFVLRHCDSSKSRKKPFTQQDLNQARKMFPGIKSLCGHNLIDPTKHLSSDGAYLVTFLRDPVKRCASFFQEACLKGNVQQPLEEWLQTEYTSDTMTRFIAGSADPQKAFRLLKDQYFFCGLTERFIESLKLIRIMFPYRLDLSYSQERVATDNKLKDQILASKADVELIKRYNQADLQLYDQVANDLFPSYLAEYKKDLEALNEDFHPKAMPLQLKHSISKGYNNLVYANLSKFLNRLSNQG